MAEEPEPESDAAPSAPPRLLLVGVEPFARELERQAALLDWTPLTTTGLDDSLAALGGLGAGDAVIVMEHQHKIANPVLVAALQSGVGYVGALGSRRMQAARVKLLEEAGATDDQVAALHCPTGLDLGARTPAESAVSIVAEIIATRSGRDPQPLRTGTNPISA
jgi:xanthine dehydrogenase accessory factor